MNTIGDGRRKRLTGEFFSARYFLIRAVALIVLFMLVHFAGLREYTSFLSGTTASPNMDMRESAFYGMAYIVCYLGAVVLAPIFALASGLLVAWQRLRERQGVKRLEPAQPQAAAVSSRA